MLPSPVYCDNCGAANRPQAKFCISCGRSPQSSSMYTPTGQLGSSHLLNQRYSIVAQLGQGGFGAVYKAEDVRFGNRLVAVKEMSQSGLSPQETAEAIDTFKREALMLAKFTHPHLPRIYDHFTDGGRWYLVMDFIEGETLTEHLQQAPAGHLSVDETLVIGIQLCTVLDFLHTRQPPIIFRDLKPANVMLTPEGHLYLIDFGIARHFKPGQLKDTTALGSPGYAAPEQYGRSQTQTTPSADIYSLGATLHQLLSGDDPADTPFQFAPLRLRNHLALPGLKTLIKQMIEMDKDKRPPSMAAIKQELQRLAALQPTIKIDNTLSAGTSAPSSKPPTTKSAPSSRKRSTKQTTSPPHQPATVSPSIPAQPGAGTALSTPKPQRSPKKLPVTPQQPAAASPSIPAQPGAGTALSTPKPQRSPRKMPVTPQQPAAAATPPVQPVKIAAPTPMSVLQQPATPLVAPAQPIGGTPVASPPPVKVTPPAAQPPAVSAPALADQPTIISPAPQPQAPMLPVSPVQNVLSALGATVGTTLATYRGHSFHVYGVTWSPDGQRIASSSGEVLVWEVATGEIVSTYRGHAGLVYAVAWSPDGQHLASGGHDQTVQLWEATPDRKLFVKPRVLTYKGHSKLIHALAWSPDGQHLASASFDQTVQIWEVKTGKHVATYHGHPSVVSAVAWSPDGKRLASAGLDNTVQVWDAITTQTLFIYRGHSEAVNALAWSPDGTRLASASKDKAVQVWDARQNFLTCRGHEDEVTDVAWSRDGMRLASASKDKTVRIWDVALKSRIFTYREHADKVNSLAWSPDGTQIASASDDKTVRVWQAV